jgi:hypothetical protein
LVGADVTESALFSVAEFAKKLGIPGSVFGTVGGSPALFNVGELAKKFGILTSDFGTDKSGVGLFNTAEFAKKLGTLVCVRAGGASVTGLLSTAEFAKKFGMLDEVSGIDTLLVSGVDAVRDITGGCLAGVVVEGRSKKDEAGLGGCSDSFAAGVDTLAVAAGLVSENGNEVIGGSFAPVKSCWIVAVSGLVKLNPGGTEKTGTFLAASSNAICSSFFSSPIMSSSSSSS